MDTSMKDINTGLPQEVLGGKLLDKEEALMHVTKLLKQHIPVGDQKNLKSDLTWHFLLEYHSIIRKRKQKQKKTFLTRRERNDMGLLKLPQEGWNYQSLKVIRNMWTNYMRQNLDLIKKAPSHTKQEWNTFSVILAKSEMVGTDLTVVKSKIPSLIGAGGTVILETKMSFQIVTKQNKLKTFLKEPSIFQFTLDSMKFTFYGKHLMSRPSERSVKKVKAILKADL